MTSNFAMRNKVNYCKNKAATLLEVLFATVVLVVGLLGIATLIPFAARDAQEANNNNQALALGLAWADSFFARGFHKILPETSEEAYRWYWRNDPVLGPQSWQDFSTSPGGSYSQLSGTPIGRQWGAQPVCLDPYLMTSAVDTQLFDRGVKGYRAAVFPYYDDGYDPLSNPTVATPGGTAFDQPRMLRASLGYFGGTLKLAPRELIQGIFGSIDEVVADSYIDPATETDVSRDLPATRLFVTGMNSANSKVALKSALEGRYTWMATVSPAEPFGNFNSADALISVVIMHKHKHSIDAGELPTAQGERLTVVQPLSGDFVGGAGGRVRISCYSDIDSKLEIGSWIVLGRFFENSAGQCFPYFRWYRVVGMDGEPKVNGTAWSREVVLDGPDFGFSNNVKERTYGTIVGGVITVVERMARVGQ